MWVTVQEPLTCKPGTESLYVRVPGPEKICNRTVWKAALKGNQRDSQMSFIFRSFTEDIKKRTDQSVQAQEEESSGMH